jgi:NSS family neurotransmitter:Na+ symporter
LVGLSYYAVVAAWTMDYFGLSIAKAFEGLDSESTQSLFGKRIAQPAYQAALHFIFMLLTVAVVSRGVKGGIERITKIMMPALFVVLVLLVIYNATLDSFGAAASFLFAPDFSEITGRSVLIALGQALFSLAIGVGLMITYGAYMPQTFSLQQSALIICLGDTLIAVLAGLAIFPIVFASGLNPGEGPSLIFITLPVAFGSMPGGQYIGSLFFLLLFFAAFTTAIGMLEPIVSWLSERARGKRPMLTVIAGAATWLLGLGSVFSFGILSDFHPLGIVGIDLNVFSLLDFGIANLLLPLNAFLLAVFVGWILRREAAVEEFGSGAGRWMAFWRFSVRYVAPVAIMMVFVDLVSG